MSNGDFIKNAKEQYKKIRYVECPAFGNEKIYFNKHGLRHLERKHGVLRPAPEQVRKFLLLRKAPSIISKSIDFSTYDIRDFVKFWSIRKKDSNKMIIIIVIRQIGDGTKHFYSIMDKKLPKSAKDP